LQITFDLPHVFSGMSQSKEENALALARLMQALVSLNEAYLLHHPARGLYQSGVVYRRTTVWDTIPALYARGYGDCKSLAAALVAQYRAGIDPESKGGQLVHGPIPAKCVFRWNPASQDVILFHILVQTPPGFRTDTGYEDPSKRLGMGKNENARY
jgi:hypothetical protein